jgi:hypothetical protein
MAACPFLGGPPPDRTRGRLLSCPLGRDLRGTTEVSLPSPSKSIIDVLGDAGTFSCLAAEVIFSGDGLRSPSEGRGVVEGAMTLSGAYNELLLLYMWIDTHQS